MTYVPFALLIITLSLWPQPLLAKLPIPIRHHGITVGSGSPLRHTVDLFVDPLCGDSRFTFQQLRPLFEQGDIPLSVQLRVLLYPLPYHPTAFLVSMAIRTVETLTNGTTALNFLAQIFENMKDFTQEIIPQANEVDIKLNLALLAESFEIRAAEFLVKLGLKEVFENTRTEWKIGSSHGVAETPAIFINDMPVEEAFKWDQKRWNSELERLTKY